MYPRFKGFEIKPSKTADNEMEHLKIYLDDVLKILNHGKDSSRSRRRSGTVERALRIRGRMIKVVAAESETRWSGEKVWLIIHVGETRER